MDTPLEVSSRAMFDSYKPPRDIVIFVSILLMQKTELYVCNLYRAKMPLCHLAELRFLFTGLGPESLLSVNTIQSHFTMLPLHFS